MNGSPSHIIELYSFLEKYGIKKNDIIIVGSAAMAVKGIRDNRDLDFALRPEKRAELLKQYGATVDVNKNLGTIYFSKNIQAVLDKYKNLNYYDTNLFDHAESITACLNDCEIVRLELEAAHKALRRRPKDLVDIDLIMDYALQADDWDWAIFRKLLNDAKTSRLQTRDGKILRSLLPPKLRSYLSFTKNAAQKIIRDPRLLKKVPGKIARKMVISQKPKPSAEVSATTVSLMPTAALLHFQRIGDEFSRYDLLVRYLALQDIEKGEQGEALDLYKQMQFKRVKRETEQEFRRLADSVRENGFSWRYPIPITGNGILLDGSHRLACALYYNIPYVPVLFASGPREVRYGRQWFEEQEFSGETLSQLDSLRRRLFLEWGLYFSVLLWH